MRKSLFRPEAAEGLRPRLEGDVVALSPLSGRIVVASAVGVFAVALLFSSLTTYSKFVPATGYLAPRDGLVQLVAPMAGDLTRITATGGKSVKAGEVLGVVENRRYLADGTASAREQQSIVAARKALAVEESSARQAVLAADANAAEARARGLEAALKAAQASLTSAARGRAVAQEQLAKNRDLAEQGFVSRSSLAVLEQALADREYTLRQAEQAVAGLRTDIESSLASARSARLQMKVASVDSSVTSAGIDSESLTLNASRESAITATVNGKVVAVPAMVGPVVAGTLLFTVSPDGPLYAHLVLPEATAAKARVGQNVVMRLAGQSLVDAERIEGELESISEGVVSQGDAASRLVGHLALVKLRERGHAFKPGSRVTARVETETRSLLGWLFEPLTRGMRQLNTNGASK